MGRRAAPFERSALEGPPQRSNRIKTRLSVARIDRACEVAYGADGADNEVEQGNYY